MYRFNQWKITNQVDSRLDLDLHCKKIMIFTSLCSQWSIKSITPECVFPCLNNKVVPLLKKLHCMVCIPQKIVLVSGKLKIKTWLELWHLVAIPVITTPWFPLSVVVLYKWLPFSKKCGRLTVPFKTSLNIYNYFKYTQKNLHHVL